VAAEALAVEDIGAGTRFRIPDVVVVAGPMPEGPVTTAPPLVAIEILSPTDRAEELQEKIDEYPACAAARLASMTTAPSTYQPS